MALKAIGDGRGDQAATIMMALGERREAELAVREVIHGRPVRNVEALANPQSLELYRDLAEASGQAPQWNFHKILIGKSGQALQAFGDRPEMQAQAAAHRQSGSGARKRRHKAR